MKEIVQKLYLASIQTYYENGINLYVRSKYFNYRQLTQNVANCCQQIYIDTSTTHGFGFFQIMFATSI